MRHIIIADDEETIRQGLLSIPWATIGVEIVGVGQHGYDTLELVRMKKPDILLTDIRMPGIDGIELTKMVLAELPEIKVILLTAYHDFEYAHSAIKLGVSEFVLKPAGKAEIMESVTKVIQELDKLEDQTHIKQSMTQKLKEYELLLQNKLVTETTVNQAVKEAIAYMQQNYANDIKIADVAEAVHLHPVYLSRLIKQETGETVHDILLRIRMQHALKMIGDQNIKLYEIAEQVGIYDARYFGQVFKRYFGKAPSVLRQQLMSEQIEKQGYHA